MPVAKGARLEGKASAQGGFATALDAWMVSARFNGLADASKIAYRKVHEPLKKFFDGPDLQTIKPNHIADWLDNHPSPVLANIGRALVSNVMQAAVRPAISRTMAGGCAFFHRCRSMISASIRMRPSQRLY